MQIDRYEVKRLLGQGAMGKVYLAEDPKLDRQVAIKVLTYGVSDPSIRRRFRLEAKAIAALKHPNIVELYDYSGEDAADLYLVMEYVPGLSLYHLIASRGPMSEATTLCVGHELAMALEHAHQNQVVHRDLKPENVLLHQGRVVLTDFGVVKAISSASPLGAAADRTRTQVLGTPGFMAPEQFTGRNIDARTDIFSFGAVLYNLATGHLPFDGDSVDEILTRMRRGRFHDPREHDPVLSEAFCELVGRCLPAKPKDRLKSATVLRGQILELLALHGVTEVRQALVDYDRDPSGYADAQRQRNVEVLVRELKVALKDRDQTKARGLIQRMQILAPTDNRVRDISGVFLDTNERPVFTGSRPASDGLWTIALFVFGVSLGVIASAVLYGLKLLPEPWLASLLQMGQVIRGE
jgi:serine/threonine-protein kinase